MKSDLQGLAAWGMAGARTTPPRRALSDDDMAALRRVSDWMTRALLAMDGGDPEPSENEGKNAHAELCALIGRHS